MTNLNKVSEIVEEVLSKNEMARNDDKFLLYAIWTKQIGAFMDFEKFKSLENFESIRRVRQKLNEEGRYLPTDEEVIKQRRLNQIKIRNWAIENKTADYQITQC